MVGQEDPEIGTDGTHFYSMTPTKLRHAATTTGVTLDSVTAKKRRKTRKASSKKASSSKKSKRTPKGSRKA